MTDMNHKRQKRQLKIMENIYGAMGCYLYIVVCIIGVVISLFICLFFAELLFPKHIHVLNYSLSARTFVELRAAHKYKAAVDFYEHKEDVFTSYNKIHSNMFDVFDCYRRIGEYEKAESLLRELYNLEDFTGEDKNEFEKDSVWVGFFKFAISINFINLYEETGNIAGQEHYYSIMKECVTPELSNYFNEMPRKIELFGDDVGIEDIIKIYDFKMMYHQSPKEAIKGMGDYIYNTLSSDSKWQSSTYIQKCMNIFINWIIDEYGVMDAYPFIHDAVEYVMNTDASNEDKSEYGNLSDICYKVHDIKNSKKLYSIYSKYLDNNTSSDDPLYIDNMVRGFKFLENEGNWTELESQVIECCTGLKSLLDKNIHTMSESQREYFVNLLEGPFDYAADLLYEHPSDKLATLCFENSIFMKGLLLRSNRDLANKIKSKGDPQLLTMYEDLQEYRKELSYRESIGSIGNTVKMKRLKKDIEELDKQLALSCNVYNIDKENTAVSIKALNKKLDDCSTIVDFIQTKSGNMFALILRKGDNVQFVEIGNKDEVLNALHSDHRRLYSDLNLTNLIWMPVEQHLTNVKDIYYSTDGIFNSISFHALSLGAKNHLADKYDFHLLSNISNVLTIQEDVYMKPDDTRLAIWGDIDYGNKENVEYTEESIFRDIVRGENLRNLVYSKYEVNAIKDIVEKHNGKAFLFTKAAASEYSFHSRSGKKDNILHVSTHGFFDEDDIHRKDYNPMYNSGLFFAGADSIWNRIDTTFIVESMMDDGILRADEIQYLNFSDCSLAVLSACKTGLGHSTNTEGVYGLQRAFKLAGVDKILMSLWNVDDKCTSELMQEFYRYYFSGNSDEDALRMAQNAIRDKYPSPEYWGAFVLLY